jgi:hypothetical protein
MPIRGPQATATAQAKATGALPEDRRTALFLPTGRMAARDGESIESQAIVLVLQDVVQVQCVTRQVRLDLR